MWCLTADNDDRVIYVIPKAPQIIIGRRVDNQVCNFAIPDQSISRKHATLTVFNNSLILHDLGSRYGTFINDMVNKIEINIDVELKEDDIVRFGKMNSVWKVQSISLNTCTSTLKGENLQNLRLLLSKIGGVLKNDWDDSCNYLTMPAITLTIKVVLALVQGANIVNTEFWTKLLESVNNHSPMPEPQNYLPTVVESTLNKEVVSFSPDIRRRSLFTHKKFVFFSRRQFEMYKPVLFRSSASPLLLSECKMTVSMLCENNVIVIQYISTGATQESQTQQAQINDIVQQLKSRGKRVIADAEIGLAVLYCSTDKYCNPNFSFTSEVVKQKPELTNTTNSKVLAQESQEPGAMKHEKENVKINETYASIDDFSGKDKQATKRKLGEFTSEIQLNPNKKVATTCYIGSIPNESTKRKLSDDQSLCNASKKTAFDEMDQGSYNSSEDVPADNCENNMFNFIDSATSNSGPDNKSKKLNFLKPQKRRLEATEDDNDLFNFIQTDDDKTSEGESSKQSIFGSNKVKRTDNTDTHRAKNNVTVTPDEISAMRGVKLKELMDSNTGNNFDMENINVKQENCGDLETKMGGLDLGHTIVITCTDLIVKKEPFKTESADDTSLSTKNFKKFKKVWPVRKQATIIPSSSMKIVDFTDTNSYSVGY